MVSTQRGTDPPPVPREGLMTVKYTFFIGLADKDSKLQEVGTLEASRIVERIFCAHGVDGATITEGRGVYVHDSGEVVTENTLLVQVFEFGAPVNVRAVCEDLKTVLNQESIAVERRETESALY